MSRSVRFFRKFRKDLNIGDNVEVSDEKIGKLIKDWLESLYWKATSFEAVLTQTGISLPVVLSDFCEEDYNFKCTTSDGKQYTLQILFGNFDDFPEISVNDGNEVRIYQIVFNYDNDEVPKITFTGRKASLGERTVTGRYTYWYHWDVEYDNSNSLKVMIKVPRNYRIDTMNCKLAEEYLLALEVGSEVDIRSIFNALMKILLLSDETIEQCKQITIAYSTRIGNSWKVRAKIDVEDGYITECAVLKHGNTYHVFSNGNWKYVGKEGVIITSIDDNITMTITGNLDSIISAVPHKLLEKAEKEIDLLWEDVW